MGNPTLLSVLEDWKRTPAVKNKPAVFKNLKTTLKRYIMPELDQEINFNSMTELEFREYCHTKVIHNLNFSIFLEVFDKNFDLALGQKIVSASTRRNYRSALRQFLKSIQSLDWYRQIFDSPFEGRTPKRTSVKRNPKAQKTREELDYAVLESDLPKEIIKDIQTLKEFWVKPDEESSRKPTQQKRKQESSEKRKQDREAKRLKVAEEGSIIDKPNVERIEVSTFDRYMSSIKRFFGWCIYIEGYSLEELSFDLLIDKVFIEDYADWALEERGCCYSAAEHLVRAAIFVAKWKTYDQSRRRNWSDQPLVEGLRNYRAYYLSKYKEEKPERDEEKWYHKEITHQQAQQVVSYLSTWCAERKKDGSKRPESAITWSWQVYLIVKILVYVPVRQEEISKLIFGKTLVKVIDRQGTERYAVRIKNHKNFRKTRRARYYPLPTLLTKDLDTWRELIRPMALKAPSNLASWLNFGGESLDKLKGIKKRIEEAKQGNFPKRAKNSKNYLESLEIQARGIQKRIDAWEAAKVNAESCEHFFFAFGRNHPEVFGTSFKDTGRSCLSSLVAQAVARATKALFGQERFLNPHRLRHISSKHLRLIGKGSQKAAFSALVGHSVEVDDEYAAQILTDFDLIEDFVDDWWKDYSLS